MEIVIGVAVLIAWVLTARVAYLVGRLAELKEWAQDVWEYNAALIEELDRELRTR